MTKNRIKASCTAFILLFFIVCSPYVSAENGPDYLIAAGTTLGVRFNTDGVVITGICETEKDDMQSSPAFEAGLRRGDMITGVNGKDIRESKALCEEIEKSEKDRILIRYIRAGREQETVVTAKKDKNGKYKLGLYVRDSASGIGTVTFIRPRDGTFAGLGHGICNPDNGMLLTMKAGDAREVMLTGINRGKAGAPGELRGFFTGKCSGTIVLNTNAGVFGIMNDIPKDIENELYEVGKKSAVHEGSAYIISTVDGSGRQSYAVELSKIDIGGGQKNFTIKVTDSGLIEKTGGIVRGMSGSPVIQDGKLIGAVTHVMISDPTMGYGIFIENMLEEIENAPANAA